MEELKVLRQQRDALDDQIQVGALLASPTPMSPSLWDRTAGTGQRHLKTVLQTLAWAVSQLPSKHTDPQLCVGPAI